MLYIILAVGVIGVVTGAVAYHFYLLKQQPLWRVEYTGEYGDDEDIARGGGYIDFRKTSGTVYVRAVNKELAYINGKQRVLGLRLGRFCFWYGEPALTVLPIDESPVRRMAATT